AALTAGQRAHDLLLVAALEIEPPEIGARRHLEPAHGQDILPAGDRLEYRLVVRQRFARLVDDREPRRGPDDDRALVGLLGAGVPPEEGRLAGAVGADDPDDRARRNVERQVVDEQAPAVTLAHAGKFDDGVAKPLGDGN